MVESLEPTVAQAWSLGLDRDYVYTDGHPIRRGMGSVWNTCDSGTSSLLHESWCARGTRQALETSHCMTLECTYRPAKINESICASVNAPAEPI